jgi:nucleotide-binding universal stress UspA family protein
MRKALLPVDGSANALAAVRHVIRLVRDRDPLEIHLLNVQPPMHGDVTMFVGGAAVREFHESCSLRALASACRLLDDDAVPYVPHVAVGHIAQVIAATASKLECDTVVMGTRGLGTVTQLLHGSVTNDVIHQLAPGITVTLVKDCIAMHLIGEAR